MAAFTLRTATATTRRLWIGLAWAGAWLPALAMLMFIAPLRVPVPSHDSWAFVEQFLQWRKGDYSWQDFMVPHNQHPSAVGKGIYFAVLEWAGGDVALLPLLTWLISLGIALSVLALSRPLWRGRPWRGAGLMLLVNLCVFTPAQVECWLWDFIFQNLIPGLCLAGALAAWQSGMGRWWKMVVVVTASMVAAFSFGTGFLVGILLVPMVMFVEEGKQRGRWFFPVMTLVVAVVAAWLALVHYGHNQAGGSGMDGRLGQVLGRPGLTVQYVLVLLGLPFGFGTALEPSWLAAAAGFALLVLAGLAAAWLWRGRDAGRWRLALPWLLLCAWSFLNALLICWGRMQNTIGTAVATRYIAFTLLFAVGVIMLLAVVWDEVSAWRPGMKKGLMAGVTVMLLLQGVGWLAGMRGVRLFHLAMVQEMAVLEFSRVIRPDKEHLWWMREPGPSLTADWAKALHDQDRLRWVKFATTPEVAVFRKTSALSSKRAGWTLYADAGTGQWFAQGRCALSVNPLELPDLILLTAQAGDGAEVFVDMARPHLPDDLYDRVWARKVFPEHYFGWQRHLRKDSLPAGEKVVVRAYAFVWQKRWLRPIPGEFVIANPGNPGIAP